MPLSDAARSRLMFAAVVLAVTGGTFLVGRGLLDRPAEGGGRAFEPEPIPAGAPPVPPPSFEIAPPTTERRPRGRAFRETAKGAAEPVVFTFAGRVFDEEEAPIAGAEVALALEVSRYQGVVCDPPVVARAKTDDAGLFRIEGLSGAERYAVSIRHAEYAEAQVRNVEAVVASTIERPFVLTRGRAIRGVVRAEGGPVAGARVRVIDLGRPTRDGFGVAEREVATDGAGRFDAGFLAPGAKALAVEAPGFVPTRLEPVGVRPRDDATLEVTLRPGKPLRGTLRRATADGRAETLADAEIVARPIGPAPGGPALPAGFSAVRTKSGAGGAFAFDALPDAHYVLWVATEDADPLPAAPEAPPDAPRDAAPPPIRPGGESLSLLLPRPTAGALAGRAFDAETLAPLTRFFVWASRVPDPNALAHGRKFVDAADGAFVVTGLGPGAWHVFVEAHGIPPTSAGPFEATAGERRRGADVPTTPGVVLAGRVVDERGKPVAGAIVAVRSPHRPERLPPGVELVYASPEARAVAAPGRGYTAEDGTFEFRAARGSWRLVVTHEETLELSTDPYHCPADLAVGDLVVVRASRLWGAVSASHGGPDVGATVALFPDGSTDRAAWRGAAVGPDGGYEFRGLKPGNYWVGVTQRGGRSLIGTPEGAFSLLYVGGGDAVRKDF